MFIFGKEVTATTKKNLVSSLVMILFSGIVLVMASIAVTVAWFLHNTEVAGTAMQIAVLPDGDELLIERSTEYDLSIADSDPYSEPLFDSDSSTDPKYPGISPLKTILSNAGYGLTATSSTVESKLAYEIVNEGFITIDGINYYALMPGSYGTITFYLKPGDGRTSGTMTYNIEIAGYANNTEGVSPTIEEVTNQTILNYLKGHILLFTEKTGDNYDGLITDGTFTYDLGANSPVSTANYLNGSYRITIYWVWPETYDDIASNISTTTPSNDKYPVELGTYFENNRNYFLAKNLSSNDPDDLNDGYNDADQLIGDYINYLVAYISG